MAKTKRSNRTTDQRGRDKDVTVLLKLNGTSYRVKVRRAYYMRASASELYDRCIDKLIMTRKLNPAELPGEGSVLGWHC